jgi:hypothetical protein
MYEVRVETAFAGELVIWQNAVARSLAIVNPSFAIELQELSAFAQNTWTNLSTLGCIILHAGMTHVTTNAEVQGKLEFSKRLGFVPEHDSTCWDHIAHPHGLMNLLGGTLHGAIGPSLECECAAHACTTVNQQLWNDSVRSNI